LYLNKIDGTREWVTVVTSNRHKSCI